MRVPRSLRRTRGSSLIETIIAMAILAMMMVGVLQMFSLSLLTNQGSAARTELLYKCQQVVENLRLIYFLARAGNAAALTASGAPATMAAAASPIYLPAYNGDGATSLTWAHWGPAGFNIVDEERAPYRLSYTVEDHDVNFWLVTVRATPVDNPRLAGSLPAVDPASRRYLGGGSKMKVVTYAAQIEK